MILNELNGFNGHEQVVFCHDADSGLEAIIAIHDTTLGPAMGGCRMRAYESLAEATNDALRLSAGMTLKNAISRLPFGGAKAVIIGDPATSKTRDRLLAFGSMINRLNGAYITAEDSGISRDDLDWIARATRFTRLSCGHAIDEPSMYTAHGLLSAIRTAVRFVEEGGLKGRVVAVEGLGKVGMRLCELLAGEGALLLVADIDEAKVTEATSRFTAQAIPSGELHQAEALVYAPCALGATLNERTIPEIRASIVAGAANNQLEKPGDAALFNSRGILYCPDFVVNAGGVLGAFEQRESDSHEAAIACAEKAGPLLQRVLEYASEQRISTQQAAMKLAFQAIARSRSAEKPPIRMTGGG